MSFLVETYGIEKVKVFYTNCLEAGKLLGRSFAVLERDWKAWIGKRRVDPKHEAHVKRTLGLLKDPMPKALAEEKGESVLNGKPLEAWRFDDASKWAAKDGALRGGHDGPWTFGRTEASWKDTRGVRARFKLVSGNAVQLRMNVGEGSSDDVILTTWGAYLARSGGNPTVASDGETKLTPGKWTEVFLVNEEGTLRLYVDGLQVLEAPASGVAEGAIGLAVERATVEFERLDRLSKPAK
jgi:hypothetical protein